MKYYFQKDDNRCYPLKRHLNNMKENDIEEMVVFEAVRQTGSDYFYCKFFKEVGEVGEGCGKECEEYKPRNGKSGRCLHSGSIYEYGKQKILKQKAES